jgi:metal-dependent amidase/aminoacylase/carboxypeptidase family protein
MAWKWSSPSPGAEDFSFFANEVPGLYISLGGKPPGTPKEQVAAHHTPDFHIDESGFDVGVRAMAAIGNTCESMRRVNAPSVGTNPFR